MAERDPESKVHPRATFRQRLFLTLLVLSFVPMTITISVALISTRAATLKRTTDQLETLADLKSLQVEHWIAQGREVASLLSSLETIRDPLVDMLSAPDEETARQVRADVSDRMAAVVAVFEYVRSISLLHPISGQVIVSSDPALEDQVWREEGALVSGQQALSVNPVSFPADQQVPVLAVSAPVWGPNAELLAVVVVEMDLADLQLTLESRVGLGETGQAYLVEVASGRLVTLPPEGWDELAYAVVESEGVRRAQEGESGSDIYLDPRGASVLGVYRWLPEANLALLVELEDEELFQQIFQIWKVVIVTILVQLALSVVGARYLTSWLVSPLDRVMETALLLRSGDLDQRVSLEGPDEIAQLGRILNEMADGLQRYYEELENLVQKRTAQLQIANEQLQREVVVRHQAEGALRRYSNEHAALYAVAAASTAFLDPDKLLSAVLDVVLSVMDAQAGWVVLLGSAPDDLPRVAASRNVSREFVAAEEATSLRTCPVCASMLEGEQAGAPVFMRDCPRIPAGAMAGLDLQGHIGIPLSAGDKVLGVMNVAWRGDYYYSDADRALMTTIGQQVGLALQNARLYQAARQVDRLQILNDITAAAVSSLELDTVLGQILNLVCQALGAAEGSVLLHDPNTQELFFAATLAGNSRPLYGTRLKPGQGVAGWVVQNGHAVRVNDVHRDPRWYSGVDEVSEFETRSILCAPLKHLSEIIGVIEIINKQGGDFTDEDVSLLESVASVAAGAIENARLYQAELTAREQLRSLAGYLQSAREEERSRIAREIHDELGQMLTALKMDLSWMIKRLPKKKSELIDKTDTMSGLIDETIKTVRRVATDLRPGLLDDLGLVAAIEWQAQEFARRTEIACELELREDIALERDLSTAFFRIFQETLTNVARHAEATRVQVTLEEKNGELTLTVQDDGRGMTEDRLSDPQSLGLIGMRERARAWGGDVAFKSVAGRGTTVTVRIPFPDGGERA